MIYFVFGTINSNFFEQTITILKKIKNKKIIIIVPEQCSFWAEKQAISIFNETKIEVEILSFSRLTQRIFQKHGGLTKEIAQKHDKITILNLTLFNLKNELPIYNYLAKKNDFLEKLLQTIEQVKTNEINYKKIKQNLQKIENKNLKLKINEFWLIFKNYNLKLNSIFSDSSSNLLKATKICDKFNTFSETEIFFTQFFSFSQLQLKFIETIAKKTNLHFNFYYHPHCDIFCETDLTINKIKQIAAKIKTPTSNSSITNLVSKSKTMLDLEQVLIKNKIKNYTKTSKIKHNENIKIFSATSIFEEVDWAATEILKLTRNNFNFADITLLTTNLKFYKTTIISSLEKFQIPFFIDDLISFQQMTLIKCCSHILKAALNTNEFISNCVALLKSDLTKFNTHKIAMFENYLYTWNITPKQFNSKFKNNPRGLIENTKPNENDNLNLELINQIRKTLVLAINKIKNSKQNSKNFSLNLIEALNILGINNYYKNSPSKFEIDKFKLEWNSLITILETIYKSTKYTNLNLKQFQFLFQSTAKNLNTKQIPPTLNCVLVGTIEKTIPNNPKITIIMGANEFNLPKKNFLTHQLFSNSDLHSLNKFKINFGKTTEELNSLNKLTAHRIICSANLKTYFSFIANSNGNNSNKPCDIIKILQKNFNIKIITSQNSNFIENCLTKSQALTQLAIHLNDNTTQSNSLKHYFKVHENFSKKQIIKKTTKNNLINKHLNKTTLKISSSQIEQFFNCPFAYFCKYILNIKPKPQTTLKKINLGSAFHFVLEKLVSNKQFLTLTENQITSYIKKYLKQFLNDNLKNSIQATKTFQQNFKKNTEMLTISATNIQKELITSNFTPTYFEIKISDDSEIKTLKIKLDENTQIEINGKIDRIDTQKHKNFTLFRIIDYKTGTKTLNYSNLILGLNLQMPIYAMCVLQNKNHFKINSINYIKILGNLTSYSITERNPSEEKINKTKNNGFFQTGLIFQNNNISNPQNTPLKLKKNEIKNKLLTETEFLNICEFIKLKIKQMANDIINFNFKKIKHYTGSNLKQNNCCFCPYCEICDSKQIEQVKLQNNISKLEFFNLISKELKNSCN